MEKPGFPSSWMARNPLGIIAAFISLIYGVSAALLGATIGALNAQNQTILVGFIVIFPFAVLGAFVWLVIKHHTKLYAPLDYRSDDGFIGLASNSDRPNIGRRLMQEVADNGGDSDPSFSTPKFAANSGNDSTTKSITIGKPNEDAPMFSEPDSADACAVAENDESATIEIADAVTNRVRRAYIAENLVFQELQYELHAAVRRNFAFLGIDGKREYVADGLLETENEIVFVEVKLISSRQSEIRRRLREAKMQIAKYREALPRINDRKIEFMIALAFDDEKAYAHAVRDFEMYASPLGKVATLRMFSIPELERKYGI